MIEHSIPPVFDKNSRVLILGSFPSVRSRKEGFFYGHPQNRFWKVIAAVTGESVPQTIDEKKALLLRRHIALWDVISTCEVEGSADSSIRQAHPNPIASLLKEAPEIHAIFCNGSTAKRLYDKMLLSDLKREALCLPSTSPANAVWTLERLQDAWTVITK